MSSLRNWPHPLGFQAESTDLCSKPYPFPQFIAEKCGWGHVGSNLEQKVTYQNPIEFGQEPSWKQSKSKNIGISLTSYQPWICQKHKRHYRKFYQCRWAEKFLLFSSDSIRSLPEIIKPWNCMLVTFSITHGRTPKYLATPNQKRSHADISSHSGLIYQHNFESLTFQPLPSFLLTYNYAMTRILRIPNPIYNQMARVPSISKHLVFSA